MPDTFARMRQLIGSTAEWLANDILIGRGEVALELVAPMTWRMKIGDGVSLYSALPYFDPAGGPGGGFVAKTGDTMTGPLTVPRVNLVDLIPPADATTRAASTAWVTALLAGIASGTRYLGTWNAETNSPALTSGGGVPPPLQGDYYIVATAGDTLVDGVDDWAVGDAISYNGTVWQKIPGRAASGVYVAPAPPLTPAPDQLWWNSELGQLFLWYDDGSSIQWVAVAPAGGGAVTTYFAQLSQANTGAENRTILLDAIATGLPVVIPAGTFDVDPFAITAPACLIGYGDKSVLRWSIEAANFITITNAPAIAFRDLTIDSNRQGLPVDTVSYRAAISYTGNAGDPGASVLEIDNVTFRNGRGFDIFAKGNQVAGKWARARITNCRFYNGQARTLTPDFLPKCIHITDDVELYVAGCDFQSPLSAESRGRNGISFQQSDLLTHAQTASVTVVDSNFRDNDDAIDIYSGASAAIVQGNRVFSPKNTGINCKGDASNIEILGNVVEGLDGAGATYGIAAFGSRLPHVGARRVLSGNTVKVLAGTAAMVVDGRHDTSATTAPFYQDTIVEGNVIEAPAATPCLRLLDTGHLKIAGNIFRGGSNAIVSATNITGPVEITGNESIGSASHAINFAAAPALDMVIESNRIIASGGRAVSLLALNSFQIRLNVVRGATTALNIAAPASQSVIAFNTFSATSVPTIPVNTTIVEHDNLWNQPPAFAVRELTIAADAITVTNDWHYVDTEADAASDNLATVNGGFDGRTVTLRAASAARVVTVKHGTGNVRLAAGGDRRLDNFDQLTLMYQSGTWYETGFADHTIAGDSLPSTVATIADLAALVGRPAVVFTLDRGGGQWTWASGDQSANVTNDPQKGLWVAPASAPTGASGAWKRIYSGGVNVLWFGAAGDSVADDTAAFQACINTMIARTNAGGGFGATITIPNGEYKLTGTLSLRVAGNIVPGLRFQGEGGYPGKSGTRLRWSPASGPTVGLFLSSAQQCEFNDIEFVCANANVSTLINIDAEVSPTFSTFHPAFNRCGFRTFSGINPSVRMLRIVNTALAEFNKCWFSGNNNSMLLGDNGVGTEGNGTAGDTLFTQCQIYWNIEVGNVEGLTFLNCVFARVDATTPVKIFPSASGFVRQQRVSFIGCSQVSVTSAVEITFWQQGAGSEGLVALNNRWDGYKTTFLIDGNGYAVLDGNIYNPPAGVIGIIGIVVGANALNVKVGAEDFSALLVGGFIGVDDNRAAPKRPLVIDASLGTDFTFASIGNYEDIITASHQFRGGLYHVRWRLNIVAGDQADFSGRILINGAIITKLSNLQRIPIGANGTLTGDAIILIDGTTAAVDVKLVCRQNLGAPGTVQASDTSYSSFVQVEQVGG